METRPEFRIDEDGDLVITSHGGVAYVVTEIIADDGTDVIRIKRIPKSGKVNIWKFAAKVELEGVA